METCKYSPLATDWWRRCRSYFCSLPWRRISLLTFLQIKLEAFSSRSPHTVSVSLASRSDCRWSRANVSWWVFVSHKLNYFNLCECGFTAVHITWCQFVSVCLYHKLIVCNCSTRWPFKQFFNNLASPSCHRAGDEGHPLRKTQTAVHTHVHTYDQFKVIT